MRSKVRTGQLVGRDAERWHSMCHGLRRKLGRRTTRPGQDLTRSLLPKSGGSRPQGQGRRLASYSAGPDKVEIHYWKRCIATVSQLGKLLKLTWPLHQYIPKYDFFTYVSIPHCRFFLLAIIFRHIFYEYSLHVPV